MVEVIKNENLDPWLEIVRQKVSSLRFGSVLVVVHEGRVTQVECTEKHRIGSPPKEGETNLRLEPLEP